MRSRVQRKAAGAVLAMRSRVPWKAAGAMVGVLLMSTVLPRLARSEAMDPRLELSAWLDRLSSGRPSTAMWIDPVLALESRRATVSFEGRFATFGLSGRDQGGRLVAGVLLDDPGPLKPEVVLVATHHSTAGGETGVRPGVRYHLAGLRAGAWISASAEGQSGGAESGRHGVRMPLLGFGAWAHRHGMTVAGVVEQNVGLLPRATMVQEPPDSLRDLFVAPGHPAAAAPEQVLLTSAYTSVHWEGEHIELESIGGVTVGPLAAPRRWAQASMALHLSPQLAVVATAGSRTPAYYAIDPTGEPRAAVALRFSEWNPASPTVTLAARAEILDCQVRALGDGRYRVTVRAPGARRVEVQGDITGWRPRALERRMGGQWEGVIEMTPGVHQIDLRVDGGPWAPPPGFPTAPDGFSGAAGVIVVE